MLWRILERETGVPSDAVSAGVVVAQPNTNPNGTTRYQHPTNRNRSGRGPRYRKVVLFNRLTLNALLSLLLGRRHVVLLLLLLLSLTNALVLRLDHGVELAFLLVRGQSGADLVNRRLPESVNLLQLHVVRE